MEVRRLVARVCTISIPTRVSEPVQNRQNNKYNNHKNTSLYWRRPIIKQNTLKKTPIKHKTIKPTFYLSHTTKPLSFLSLNNRRRNAQSAFSPVSTVNWRYRRLSYRDTWSTAKRGLRGVKGALSMYKSSTCSSITRVITDTWSQKIKVRSILCVCFW